MLFTWTLKEVFSSASLKLNISVNTLFLESDLVSAIQKLRYRKRENYNCRWRRGGILIASFLCLCFASEDYMLANQSTEEA